MIRFELPIVVSTNKFYESKHWTFRNKIKNQYRDVAFTGEIITEYPVDCHYTFYIANNFDTSNLSIMQKLIEDCLVKKGILKNDSPKYVNRISIGRVKSKESYCEIKIEKAN